MLRAFAPVCALPSLLTSLGYRQGYPFVIAGTVVYFSGHRALVHKVKQPSNLLGADRTNFYYVIREEVSLRFKN